MRYAIAVLAWLAALPAGAAYLPDYDLTLAIPPPPADDSARTKQDLVAIHRWQVMRTADMVARAKQEAEDGILAFRDPLGELFDPARLPRTSALLAGVRVTADAAIRRAQSAFRRRPPASVDGSVRVCDGAFPANGAGVYPALGPNTLMLEALLLARMVPERADLLVNRARTLAADRVMCGAHYPSDIEAAFMAASAFAAMLDQNPGFAGALTGARSELRSALALPEPPIGLAQTH